MKRPFLVLALCAGTAMIAVGCGRAVDPPQPDLSQSVPPAPESSPTPAVKVPDWPDPAVPKGAEAASPVPGQAGDQSSPAFKAGGKTDPHK